MSPDRFFAGTLSGALASFASDAKKPSGIICESKAIVDFPVSRDDGQLRTTLGIISIDWWFDLMNPMISGLPVFFNGFFEISSISKQAVAKCNLHK